MQPVLPFILQEPLGSTPSPRRRPSLNTVRYEVTRIVSPAPNDDPWGRGTQPSTPHRDSHFQQSAPTWITTSYAQHVLPPPQASTTSSAPNTPSLALLDSAPESEPCWTPSSGSNHSASCSSSSSASYDALTYGTAELDEGPVRFRCDQCTESFASNGALKKHKYTHLERNFRCHCGLAYTTMSVLRKHQYLKGCGPSPTSAAWSHSGSSSPESGATF
ncbi:hypothetical protein BD289DRAFT_443456, partial [Coniella lustricola]